MVKTKTKTNRYISIDIDINDKLESVNASALINELLINYFKNFKSDNPQEKEIQLAKELEMLEEQQRRLKEDYEDVKKTLDAQKLKELEINNIEYANFLDKKKTAVIRAKAQKEFNLLPLDEKEDKHLAWEKFYADYVKNYKEVQQ